MSDSKSFIDVSYKSGSVDDITERNDETCTVDIDEFELPPIEQVPSLNEILNQDDENGFDFSSDLNDVLSNCQHKDPLLFDDRSDITSISASTSTASLSKKFFRANERAKISAKSHVSKSDILRRTKLRAISNQIVTAKEQVDAGTPTTIAVCEKYIGVGTSHGLVLVFGCSDAQQVLKCCLGSNSSVFESGGVAALDFNSSGTRLLIGYANGWIHLYDVQTAKLIQRLSEAHPPGYSVLHLKFCTPDGGTAALNDSGGSVFELTLGRMTRSATGRCIFSGSRGEVCNIAPLLVPPVFKKPCALYSGPILLAMASLTKVIVVRLVPSTRVVFALALSGRPESAPLLCWQFTQVQITEKNRIVDPVLSFARDNIIYSYQLHTSDGEKFRAFAMHKVDFRPQVSLISQPTPMMTHMQWLNYRYLLVLDSSEKLSLYEPGCGDGDCCLETADLSHAKLVYDASTFKALVTGGNVSKALACVASKICYHSFVVLNNQVFILGSDAVYSIVMRTWLERVDGLIQVNDYPGAVRLVLDFYTGRKKLGAGVLMNNRKGGTEKWRPIVVDKGVHLLLNYVELAMTTNSSSCEKVDPATDHFKTIIPLCMEACITLDREDVLYESIYPRFTSDQAAKAIFMECLDDYIANNLLTNLPPAIVQDYFYHLEKEGLYGSIESSVVRLPVMCLDLHQVMTLCRTHNLYDGIIYVYNQALKDFLTPLKEMINSLVHIVSERELLTDEDIRLGNKVLLYISCCLSGQMYPVGNLDVADARRVATEICDYICLSESKDKDTSMRYPYLRSLLKFDCREFLNVLSMAFGSQYLDIDEQQRLIDMLVQVMLDDTDWVPFQTGALFTFVMRQVVVKSGDIGVTRDHFRQLLKVVFRGKLESIGTCSFEERQQALIEFLQWSKSSDLVDEDEVLSLAEKAQYFQVCEILYGRRRQFHKIVECYAKHAFRREQIFDYVLELYSNFEMTDAEKASVRSAYLDSISAVGGLNVQRCADTLLRFFPDALPTVCEQLDKDDATFLVALLKAVLEIRHSSGQIGFVDESVQDQKLARLLCQRLCKEGDSDSLLQILMMHDEFCTDEVLTICKKSRATKPLAYMLERKGRLEEAFLAVYEDIIEVAKSYSSSQTEFESLILFASSFLKDKYHRFTKDQLEGLWFKLLLLLMNVSVEQEGNTSDLKAVIVNLVHEMIRFVNPSQVLPKLLDHPLFHGGSYAEFHDLIDGILKGYSYDEVLLSKFVSSIYGEIHASSVRLRKLSSTGCRAYLGACSACGQSLSTTESRNAVVFDCSHSYHSDCLHRQRSYFISQHSVQELVCSVCNKTSSTTTKTLPRPSNDVTLHRDKWEKEGSKHTIPKLKSISKFEALEELEAVATKTRAHLKNTAQNQTAFDAPLALAPPRI